MELNEELCKQILARERAVNMTNDDWHDLLDMTTKARDYFDEGNYRYGVYDRLKEKLHYILEVWDD